MNILFLDCETTGIDPAKGHQIIEFAGIYVPGKLVATSHSYRIKPTRAIDADATKVHGIAISDLAGCPDFKNVASDIHNLIVTSDVLVAHNADFDISFLAAEYERLGMKMPEKKVFCTMTNGRWACFDGKFPTLQQLCFALGINYDPALAHAALYDTERLRDCFFQGADRGFFQLT